MERLTKKELCSYTNMDLHSMQMDWHSIYNKLAEFEDFMEEQGVESLEDLKINIEYLKDKIKTDKFNYEQLHKFKSQLQKENQALKERWEKLKEFIEEHLQYDKEELLTEKNLPNRFYLTAEKMILEKMQELEE